MDNSNLKYLYHNPDYLDCLMPEQEAARFLGYTVRAVQNWRTRGGGGGIRTPETLTRPPVFETTGIYVTTCYILRFQIVGNIVGKYIQHIGKLST